MGLAWRALRARATRALWKNAVSQHCEGGRLSPGKGPCWTRAVGGLIQASNQKMDRNENAGL
jgi:hypothetical protein